MVDLYVFIGGFEGSSAGVSTTVVILIWSSSAGVQNRAELVPDAVGKRPSTMRLNIASGDSMSFAIASSTFVTTSGIL